MGTTTAVTTPKAAMASISFITPYMPIVCGIADYTAFITRECLPGRWNILSFDLANYGVPLSSWQARPGDPVRYCIRSRWDFSASSVLEALNPDEDQVLWFQHEFGIWSNSERFVSMLRDLNYPRVVTLHTLHFQSDETVYGLRRREYSFLRMLLPHTDAITVFSNGVYKAVTQAFTKYADKVHVLRHGTHACPEMASMIRQDAKARMHEYLMGDSGLEEATKDNLRNGSVLNDPDTIVIGGAGFVTASKGVGPLFRVRDMLQQMMPETRIVAVYVGSLRVPDNRVDSRCAAELRMRYNSAGKFFLETYLPGDMLPVILRALDVYFYWPSDCTQSGIVAHALGAGAVIACRDMEGVGETVKMAGGLTSKDLGKLTARIRQVVLNRGLRNEISQRAFRYAEEFSWKNQALKHFKLAEQLLRSKQLHRLPAGPPLAVAR
jgi:glycosyltransferase involved in cell wall biosynthesis